MFQFAGVILGIGLLIAGGAFLVRGASQIAARMGVSPMLVGLTVVAFGTSAPELVVNVLGAMSGATELAFGNVVGSNISNLALVLGMAALFMPIEIQGDLVRREVPLLLLATTVMTIMVLDGPLESMPARLGRSDSIVLLCLFGIFIYITAMDLIRLKKKDPLLADIRDNPLVVIQPEGRYWWLLVAGGCVLLLFGGEMTIRNGVSLAERVGLPTAVVGLFVVAVGTSMPELVTSVVAAARKESDLAVGNVIGSNLFNSLFVLPISGVIAQIVVPRGGVVDLALSWLLAAALIPIFIFGRARLGRPVGVALLIGYFAYAALRVRGAA